MTVSRVETRRPQPLIPFRILEIALVVLVLFPFSIFAIRSREQVLSRQIGDGDRRRRSRSAQPTRGRVSRRRERDAGDAPRTSWSSS